MVCFFFKTLHSGRSVNKLSTEPLRIIHETLEESTDWLYGFISLLSDIIWSDDDDSDEGIHNVKISVTALTAVLHALRWLTQLLPLSQKGQTK